MYASTMSVWDRIRSGSALRSEATARGWLDREVKALGAKRPRELLLEGRIERVTAVLLSLNVGASI